MPFFVIYEQETQAHNRIPTRNVVAANQAFATREDAEAGLRLMAETATRMAMPVPDFRIIEANTIQEALFKVSGIPPPPAQA